MSTMSGFSVSEDSSIVNVAIGCKLTAPPCNNTPFAVKDPLPSNLQTSGIKVAEACKEAS